METIIFLYGFLVSRMWKALAKKHIENYGNNYFLYGFLVSRMWKAFAKKHIENYGNNYFLYGCLVSRMWKAFAKEKKTYRKLWKQLFFHMVF